MMLVKLREKHIWIYSILVLILFKVGQDLSDFPLSFVFGHGLYPKNEATQVFYGQMIADLVVLVVMLLVLWQSKKLKLLTKKGIGFFKGLPMAAYPIGYSLFALIASCIMALGEGASLASISDVLVFVLCMFIIGLSEELCTRVIIAQSFLEHFGTNSKGVWKSAIFSGILFGCLHLINLQTRQPIDVFVQCVVAGIGGITYAAIYFRTGNYWILVFVHALNDFGTSAMFGLFSYGNILEAFSSGTSNASDLSGLMLAIPEIFVILFLLRKSKIGEVKKAWPEIHA